MNMRCYSDIDMVPFLPTISNGRVYGTVVVRLFVCPFVVVVCLSSVTNVLWLNGRW